MMVNLKNCDILKKKKKKVYILPNLFVTKKYRKELDEVSLL